MDFQALQTAVVHLENKLKASDFFVARYEAEEVDLRLVLEAAKLLPGLSGSLESALDTLRVFSDRTQRMQQYVQGSPAEQHQDPHLVALVRMLNGLEADGSQPVKADAQAL